MKCITFSFYKSYYYFIIFWISSFLLSFFISLYEENLQDSQENNRNSRVMDELLDLTNQIGGDLIAGFLVLYTYITTGSLTMKETQTILVNTNMEINSSKKMKRCTLILIVSILEFIYKGTNTILSLYYTKLKYVEYMWLISIIILSRIFFSHYLLKMNLYKHHFISLIIFLIGYLFMGILSFLAGDFSLEKWPLFSFFIFKYILNGLEDVLNKILLTNRLMLPHLLIFLRGLYNLGMLIILVFILKFAGIEIILRNNIYIYIIFIFLLIVYCCSSLITMEVIYIFSPQHVSFLNIVFQMCKLIYYRISHKYPVTIIISQGIVSLFMIFSTLIFSEMIIINKWGMNENTKEGFLIRAKQELDEQNGITELMDNEDEGKEYEDENEKNEAIITSEKNNYSNY